MKKAAKIGIWIFSGFFIAALIAWQILIFTMSTKAKIVNKSSARLTNLRLKVVYGSHVNEKIYLRKVPDLGIGEIYIERLSEGDSELFVLYTLHGKEHELECGYISNNWDTFEVKIEDEFSNSECNAYAAVTVANAQNI